MDTVTRRTVETGNVHDATALLAEIMRRFYDPALPVSWAPVPGVPAR